MKILPILAVVAVAIASSLISYNGLKNPNYTNLIKTLPPGIVFSLVWGFIYITYAYVWSSQIKSTDWPAQVLFTLNILFNFFWVWYFFGGNFSTPDIYSALLIIYVLLAILLIQVIYMFKYYSKSGVAIFLLLIYCSWVLVASGFNRQIYNDNK